MAIAASSVTAPAVRARKVRHGGDATARVAWRRRRQPSGRWTVGGLPVVARVTVPAVRSRKASAGSPPLVMVTAYDAPTARLADGTG